LDPLVYFRAKNGELSAKIAHHLLHSSYNPSHEAANFLQKQVFPLHQAGQTLFLVGSSLAYIEKILLVQYPAITFISYDFIDYQQVVPVAKKLFSQTDRKSELSALISDNNYSQFQLVIWPAVRHIYALECKLIEDHFNQAKASAYTLQHFGARWLRNSFLNFLDWQQQLILPKVSHVVLIASGASLNRAIPHLKKMQNYYFIVAVSSAVYTLRHHGLEPDLVINIDGGFYAKQHLADAAGLPLINAFFGAYQEPSSFLSLGSFFDKWVTRSVVELPSTVWAGTVMASAIDIALQIATDEVVLIGQDLSLVSGKTHANPHRFESDYRASSGRMLPLESQYYNLASHSQATLPQYADWFSTQSWPMRLKRLYPSSVEIGVAAQSVEFFCGQQQRVAKNLEYRPTLAYAQRKELLGRLLACWQQDMRRSPLVQFLVAETLSQWVLAKNCGDDTLASELQERMDAQLAEHLMMLARYL
jgi:Protein of unknown function DUF115